MSEHSISTPYEQETISNNKVQNQKNTQQLLTQFSATHLRLGDTNSGMKSTNSSISAKLNFLVYNLTPNHYPS